MTCRLRSRPASCKNFCFPRSRATSLCSTMGIQAGTIVSIVAFTMLWIWIVNPRNMHIRVIQLSFSPRNSCVHATAQPSDRLWYLRNGPILTSSHDIPSMKRVSSSPFISGDTFRAMADFVMDETNTSKWTAEDVKSGSVIFVKTDRLMEFFAKVHPAINRTYILISHNSDYGVPHDPRGGCQQDCSRFVLDHQLGRWFGQNMAVTHPKMVQVPIGINNYRWPTGDIKVLASIAENAPVWHDRSKFLYINIGTHTHPQRAAMMQPLTQIHGAISSTQRVSWLQYLRELADTKFVAAPPGNGLDTHRAWEAVILGAVPVLLKGPLDSLFEGMPVVLVDDYKNVTTELLTEFELQRCAANSSTRQAWAHYWQQVLTRTKAQLQTGVT